MNSPLPLDALTRFSRSRILPVFVLLCAAFAAYAPSLNGEFLWDDQFLVGDNPFFKSPIFFFEVFRHYLYLDSFSVYYRPVQNLSYMFDYWMWGGNSFGYHLANIAYHGLAGVLLFFLLKRLLPALLKNADDEKAAPRDFAVAFGVALLWCVHPIHNAAVAYVAGRADTLAMLFCTGAWLLILRARSLNSALGQLALGLVAAFFALLALCSKEIAIIWIGLFVLHTIAFDAGRTLRQRCLTVGAALAVVLIYAWIRHVVSAAYPRTQLGADAAAPFAARVILMLRALGDYTSLIFFPAKLHMERIVFTPQAYRDPSSWARMIGFEYLSVIGMLTLMAFAWACWKPEPGQRLRWFGAAWFVLGFLPISNLFPLNAQVAEHWIYMPSIGFLIFLAGCILAAPLRWQPALGALTALVAVAFGARTAARSAEWADPEAFYKQTLASGSNSNRVTLNLALVYSKRGDLKQAEQVLRDAVQRFPGYITARINLGMNLISQGRAKEAEEFLKYDKPAAEVMAKQFPHTWSAALNIAHIQYEKKNTADALATLDDAIPRYPGIWELVRFKATILQATQGPAAALALVEPTAAARWWDYDVHLYLGRLKAMTGDTEGAIAALRHASMLDIRGSEPFSLIARMELDNGRREAAYEAQLKAVHRAPDQPSQYVFLAVILDEMNRKDESQEALRKAEALRTSAKGKS